MRANHLAPGCLAFLLLIAVGAVNSQEESDNESDVDTVALVDTAPEERLIQTIDKLGDLRKEFMQKDVGSAEAMRGPGSQTHDNGSDGLADDGDAAENAMQQQSQERTAANGELEGQKDEDNANPELAPAVDEGRLDDENHADRRGDESANDVHAAPGHVSLNPLDRASHGGDDDAPAGDVDENMENGNDNVPDAREQEEDGTVADMRPVKRTRIRFSHPIVKRNRMKLDDTEPQDENEAVDGASKRAVDEEAGDVSLHPEVAAGDVEAETSSSQAALADPVQARPASQDDGASHSSVQARAASQNGGSLQSSSTEQVNLASQSATSPSQSSSTQQVKSSSQSPTSPSQSSSTQQVKSSSQSATSPSASWQRASIGSQQQVRTSAQSTESLQPSALALQKQAEMVKSAVRQVDMAKAAATQDTQGLGAAVSSTTSIRRQEGASGQMQGVSGAPAQSASSSKMPLSTTTPSSSTMTTLSSSSNMPSSSSITPSSSSTTPSSSSTRQSSSLTTPSSSSTTPASSSTTPSSSLTTPSSSSNMPSSSSITPLQVQSAVRAADAASSSPLSASSQGAFLASPQEQTAEAGPESLLGVSQPNTRTARPQGQSAASLQSRATSATQAASPGTFGAHSQTSPQMQRTAPGSAQNMQTALRAADLLQASSAAPQGGIRAAATYTNNNIPTHTHTSIR